MKMGHLLKEKRESLNLTLEDVSDHLKISIRILKAIEDENLVDYPPPTILKGFIRSYKKYLKMEKVDASEDQEATQTAKEVWPVDPKNDPSHFEVDEELTLSSWLKWTFAGLLLVVGAVGVRIYQKYESEVYEPQTQKIESAEFQNEKQNEKTVSENTLNDKNENNLNQTAPLQESATTSTEAASKVDQLSTHPEDVKVVTSEPPVDQINEASIKKDLPSQGVSNEASSAPVSVDQKKTPTSDPIATQEEKKELPLSLDQPEIRFLPKEMIIEAKKNMTFTLKKEGASPLVKNLEAGKFYLFREEKPFRLESPDGTSMRVIMNGRIFYKAGSQDGPVILEIRE